MREVNQVLIHKYIKEEDQQFVFWCFKLIINKYSMKTRKIPQQQTEDSRLITEFIK